MSAPVFGTNATRLSMIHAALSWAQEILQAPSSPDQEHASAFVSSCMTALKPDVAVRFAGQSPLAQTQALLADDAAKMHLGMQASTLLAGAGCLTDPDWSTLQTHSPALELPQLYTDPKRQHKAEAALAKGGTFLYPAGVLGSVLKTLDENAEDGTYQPGDVGHSVAAFSNPDFGDTPDKRENLMAGKVPGLEEKDILTNFFKDDRLHPAAVPSRHRALFAQHARRVVLAPVAQGLANCFPVEMARAVKAPSPSVNAISLISAVKGLNESGMTALEYIERTLNAVSDPEGAKKVSVIDVLGYIPAVVFMKHMQEYKTTGVWKGDPLHLVLACPDHDEALALARKWCRADAAPGKSCLVTGSKNDASSNNEDAREVEITKEIRNGIEYTVVENKSMVPPLKIVLLTDPVAIKANELASVYKNLMGLKLGRELFQETLRCVEDVDHPLHATQLANRGITEPAAQEEERREYLKRFYKKREKIAEREIYEAINLDLGITNAKKLILAEVKEDMYGSWTVTDFNRVYQLTRDVFSPTLSNDEREEGIVKFKFNVGSAFTVRNIQYGFAWAADEAALGRNFSLKRSRATELLGRLVASGDVPAKSEIFTPKNGGFFYFSLIPDKLTAEGVSIAENLPRRYKKRFNDLPEGIKEASRFVQRFHLESFLGNEARTELLKLSREMAQALLPLERLEGNALESSRDVVIGFISRISDSLDKAESHLRTHLTAVIGSPLHERAKQSLEIIDGFRRNLEEIRDRIGSALEANHFYYAWIMQEMIEIMALSNRIDIVPPSAVGKQAAEIGRKLSMIPPAPAENGSTSSASLPDRTLLASLVMPSMTDLVFDMSQKLHSPTAVIRNSYLTKIIDEWEQNLRKAQGTLTREDHFKPIAPSITAAIDLMRKIKKALRSSHTPQMRGYALQALIELVIHARRLFIVGTQEDFVSTMKALEARLERLYRFLDTGKANADTKPATPFMPFTSLREAA